jgi:hypothetical protein
MFVIYGLLTILVGLVMLLSLMVKADAVTLMFAVVLVLLLVALWARVFVFPIYRGPVLAADSAGLWMRRKIGARFAVYVPWAAVRRIDTEKVVGGHLLRVEVDPAFPWPRESAKATRTLLLGAHKGPGTLVQVAVTAANRAQLFSMLAELSGGRVPIG